MGCEQCPPSGTPGEYQERIGHPDEPDPIGCRGLSGHERVVVLDVGMSVNGRIHHTLPCPESGRWPGSGEAVSVQDRLIPVHCLLTQLRSCPLAAPDLRLSPAPVIKVVLCDLRLQSQRFKIGRIPGRFIRRRKQGGDVVLVHLVLEIVVYGPVVPCSLVPVRRSDTSDLPGGPGDHGWNDPLWLPL